MQSRSIRFGAFLPPHHKVGLNPTLGLRQDLDLIDHLDALGYDEVWIGEHHSSGVETIASPELMIAAAAERTTRIKLGTGVSSLPYHHPYILADRIVQLDHMTRGRMMFGAGPGQLFDDATALGIDPSTQRPRLEDALDVILRLFRGETVTEKTDWYVCQDAMLQLRPFSDFDIAVTAAVSPSGPQLAGRHGLGMLSLAAADPTGRARLAEHWNIAETEAAAHGTSVSRSNWRLMGPMHIAETREQARRDVEYGLSYLVEFLSHVSPAGVDRFDDVDLLVDHINETGRGVIGTPDMAVEFLDRLIEASGGGFGCFLLRDSDFARFAAKKASYQLLAEEVVPQFTGALEGLTVSHDRLAASGDTGARVTAEAQAAAAERYRARRNRA